jgi:hypothetical protein
MVMLEKEIAALDEFFSASWLRRDGALQYWLVIKNELKALPEKQCLCEMCTVPSSWCHRKRSAFDQTNGNACFADSAE